MEFVEEFLRFIWFNFHQIVTLTECSKKMFNLYEYISEEFWWDILNWCLEILRLLNCHVKYKLFKISLKISQNKNN